MVYNTHKNCKFGDLDPIALLTLLTIDQHLGTVKWLERQGQLPATVAPKKIQL